MLRACLFTCVALCAYVSDAHLRVVSWNTGGEARSGTADVLHAIGLESVNGFAQPIDVLSLQEQGGGDTATIVDALNSLYGPGAYAAAPTPAGASTSGGGLPGLVYRVDTIDLLQAVAFGDVTPTAQARSTLRYQLRPDGYGADADFYVYSNHYKASQGSSNEARRLHEATAVRNDLDALGEGTLAILTGDFNTYESDEPGYQMLLSQGAGQAFDPLNRPGDWHDAAAFKDLHTQSPTTASFYGGQVTAGMDDRFDFQLITGELLDGLGMDYWPGSYRAFGNNGTHNLNGDITTGAGAPPAVLQALRMASDHLPVVVDYLLPGLGLAGDYNGDTVVDALDYAVWRQAYAVDPSGPESAYLSGNGDGQHGVDIGDFQLWLNNYGAAAPGPTPVAPEPAALMLALVGVAIKARRRA